MVDYMSESTVRNSGSNCLQGLFRCCFGSEGSEPQFQARPAQIDFPVLQEFKLYATDWNYYLIGRDLKKSFWRILKIDRRDPNELNLHEDPTRYTREEIRELIRRLIAGNRDVNELKAFKVCYGIIGFVRFLEPYYMLVITKRKKVGEICGHSVYGIAESKMIMIPNRTILTPVGYSEDEHRYKKLLEMVDLTKNFYFSYTYHLMYCLQKNVDNTRYTDHGGKPHDEKMFVWNAFLTRGIRGILKNTIWTVALVYGFFQQTYCLVSGEKFALTVISRRSRHYAGTRYLRRGVNDNGRVANDVETEQIVSKVVPEGEKIAIASVVQIRGSIPLYWSQEGSFFNPQPKITLNKKDPEYKASKKHFENLKERYGERIMILNLLKTGEKKKNRENILRLEFKKAIKSINRGLEKEDQLKAIHFDLSKEHKSADGAFHHLCIFAKKALQLTDFFACEAPLGVGAEKVIHDSVFNNPLPSQDDEEEALKADITMYQMGVFRTNCIDCLDRTNFAQYVHGLVALAHQLRQLGISGPPVIHLKNPLAIELMKTYQNMGDTIALQYGGSEAHSKMFCDLRGESSLVTRQRDYLTAVRRFLSNSVLDKEKQNAINVFLGHFIPQHGEPALWEMDLDQHSFGRFISNSDIENIKPKIQRSKSDNMLPEGELKLKEPVLENPQTTHEGLKRSNSSGTNLEFTDYDTEPASLSFNSAMSDEDLLRETWSRQMFRGSSSISQGPSDVPGFEHSYDTKFTPAEEIFESYSLKPWSSDSDLDETVTFLSTMNFSFNVFARKDGPQLIHGFSNDFSDWAFSERSWS